MNYVDAIILIIVGFIVFGIIYHFVKTKDDTECHRCAYAKKKS